MSWKPSNIHPFLLYEIEWKVENCALVYPVVVWEKRDNMNPHNIISSDHDIAVVIRF